MDAATALVSSNEKGCLSKFYSLVQPLAPDRGYLFWPAMGYWRRGQPWRGFGKLIEEMRRASSGPAVASDAML
jgi:hypothetical protein